MSRRRTIFATAICAGGFSVAFVAVALCAPGPRLIWNASASAPIGLYRVVQVDRPALGELVVVMPPDAVANFMARRRYLPVGVPLMKHMAALPGQDVCRHGAVVTVDGQIVALARGTDRSGRPLPAWQGCRLVRTGDLFLLNAAPDSLDGRYFGTLPVSGLIGTAHPLLTRVAPGRPLRWHGLGASTHFPQQAKEPTS